MKRNKLPKAPESAARTAHFRSGAVARMAQMPVATLRIWSSATGRCSHHRAVRASAVLAG